MGLVTPSVSFNLYMEGDESGDGWRWLGEVRFTYLPNGTVPTAQAHSPTPPPAHGHGGARLHGLDGPSSWGGVIIERAYVERTFRSWLTVRAGQFLTPYGHLERRPRLAGNHRRAPPLHHR